MTRSGSRVVAEDAALPLRGDKAQSFLVKHLGQTESSLRSAIRTLDPAADCQIRYAADLGMPWDVLRLAGGFATGCIVDWNCSTPIVPIDTTMNVDLTSVFELSRAPDGGLFDEANLGRIRRTIGEESCFAWNFESGNHFLSLCRDLDRWILVLHSNDREFKSQYNGLYPSTANWYAKDIRVFEESGRTLRLLVGASAELFAKTSEMLRSYNRVRHEMIAECVVDGRASILSAHHKEHYFMPGPSTACLGAFLCDPSEHVVVFSQPGAPLAVFEPHEGGLNAIELLSGGSALIVPHGWGVGMSDVAASVDWPNVELGGRRHRAELGNSLFGDPAVLPRKFASQGEFFDMISRHVPGRIVRELVQIESCSRAGVFQHMLQKGGTIKVDSIEEVTQ